MSFEVRTEFGNIDPEAKRALVAMQHAIRAHLDDVDRRARRPKRQVTEVVEEGGVVAKPGQVVRVRPGDTDVQVVLPTPDAGNGGEDIIVSFEGDGTATGKVLVTPANSTCANPGTTTLNTPGTYRFTSTGAPGEQPDEQGSTWGGPAPLSLDDLPEVGAGKVLGNNTAAPATPIELTGSQVLDLVGSTRGSVLERGATGWTAITPGSIELPIVSKGAGADPVYQQLATAGIQDDAVTNAKLANMAAATIKLRASGAGTGDPTDGTITQALDMVGSTRGSLLERGASSWNAITPGTTEFPLCSKGAGADPVYQRLPNAGLATMTAATIKLRASGAGTGDPTDGTITQALDMAGSTRGSLLERGASTWGVITPGTTGLPLVSQGAGADPTYTKITSTGSLLGWDDVLVNDATSGATNPVISAGQSLQFANGASPSAITDSGTLLQIASSNNSDVEVRAIATNKFARIISQAGSVQITANGTGGGIVCSKGIVVGLGSSFSLSSNQAEVSINSTTARPRATVRTTVDTRNLAFEAMVRRTTASSATNSTSVLDATGTYTIPANSLGVGSVFRYSFFYRFVRGATATALNLNQSLDAGGSSIAVGLASQTAAGTYHMRVEGEFTVLTTGAGGTAMAVLTTYGTGSTVAGSVSGVEDIAFAIDTTTAFDIRGSIQMSAAVANCTIRTLGGHILWIA